MSFESFLLSEILHLLYAGNVLGTIPSPTILPVTDQSKIHVMDTKFEILSYQAGAARDYLRSSPAYLDRSPPGEQIQNAVK
jgi:hypothetical protein